MQSSPPQWVTIREAAAALGVSADTVRRRLKTGALVGEKRPTDAGLAWFVQLPADLEPQQPRRVDQDQLKTLQDRVAYLEERNRDLLEDRDAWKRQAQTASDANREMRILLQQAQQLAGALPASIEDHDAGGGAQPTHPPAPAQGSLLSRIRKRIG
jgi:hypothetical protein